MNTIPTTSINHTPLAPTGPATPSAPLTQTAVKTDQFAFMIFAIRGEFYEVRVEGKTADREHWEAMRDLLAAAFEYHFGVDLPKKMEIAEISGNLVVSDLVNKVEPLNSQYAPDLLKVLRLFKQNAPEKACKKHLMLPPSKDLSSAARLIRRCSSSPNAYPAIRHP